MTTMDGFADYKKSLDEFSNETQSMKSNQKFWLFVVRNGRWANLGWRNSETESYQRYCEIGEGRQYEIVSFPTTSTPRAQGMFKMYLLERKGVGLGEATSIISRKEAESGY